MINKYYLNGPCIEAVQYSCKEDLEDLKSLCPQGDIITMSSGEVCFNIPDQFECTWRFIKKTDYLVKFILTNSYGVFSEEEFNKIYEKEKKKIVIPTFTKKIGIFYLDKKWATSIYDDIFITIPQDCIILPMEGENNCNLKGGGWIKTFYANNPIRGLSIDEAIIQSTVNKKRRNDIEFSLLRDNHVQIID